MSCARGCRGSILSVLVFVWGLPPVKAALDAWTTVRVPVPALHNLIERVPPVVAEAAPEPAVFAVSWLSATGTGIFSPRSSRVSSWGARWPNSRAPTGARCVWSARRW